MYSEFIDDEHSKVSFGNVIWISLPEKDIALYFKKKYLKNDQFEKCKNKKKKKKFFYIIWIAANEINLIENYREKSRNLVFQRFSLKNTTSMWKIESVDIFKGGLLLWDQKIRLKNLRSLSLFFFFLFY